MTRALEGLKILDLSMNLPGPYLTWLLTGLGAQVLKVENPQGGDYGRTLGGPTGAGPHYFEAVNRNKKSLALNLKHKKGRDIFISLLETHEVLVEGFRPGAMERLGLGYESLRERYPKLIQVSISGYGQDGPNRLRAGHDLNYLALSGVLGMTGSREGTPSMPGIQIADLAGGAWPALAGLLAAIIQREQTGRGQWVDASMFDGTLSLSTMIAAGVEAGLDEPGPGSMFLNGLYPCYHIYETKDGRYFSVAALEPKFWQNFCAALNRPDLLEKQYAGPGTLEEIGGIFASQTLEYWIGAFSEVDACCEPVLCLDEVMDSPLARSRDMVGKLGGRRYLANPLKLSDSPVAGERPAPALGQHSREVLADLGFSSAAIGVLAGQGVVGLAPEDA